MISLTRVMAFRPHLERDPQELLTALDLLGLPATEFDPSLEVSFGDAVVLWIFAEMRDRCALSVAYIKAILRIWGPALRDAVNATTVETDGKMPTLAIVLSDRRFVSIAGLDPQPPYDLIKCQWVQQGMPLTVEGLSYNLSIIAAIGWEQTR